MQEILRQAEVYRENALCTGLAHYKSAEKAERMHNWFGIPVVVTTTIVGTTLFVTISSEPGTLLRLVAGLTSLFAAVLASLQTFFKFSERSQKHKAAGANYSALRKEIEIFKLRYGENQNSDKGGALLELDRIAKRLAELASSSPNVKDKTYKSARREIKGE